MAGDPPESETDKLLRLADESLDRHAALVGYVAIRWAELHANLGNLFELVATPDNIAVGQAVWNALKVDRAQRDMLEAVAKVTLRGDPVLGEIQWALGQILPLEDNRNTAVHAPYIAAIAKNKPKILPFLSSGNPRSAKLEGKDLDLELTSYRTRIEALSSFVMLLFLHFLDRKRFPLPPRPRLPRPAQPTTRKEPRPQDADK